MTEATEAEAPAATTSAIAEYNPVAAGLAALRGRLANVAYDLRTTKGQEQARRDRKELVSLRSTLEARRKELKAPALERARLIDSEAKRIEADILALETPIDQQIRADEQRRETERAAKIEAERQRIDAIQRRIQRFGAYLVRAIAEPSEVVENLIRELVEAEPDASYDEFRERAAAAHAEALRGLRDLLAKVVQQENEAAILKAEREQLERERQAEEERRAEQARADAEARAERERAEAEARRAEDARIEAERQEEAARQRAEREKQDAELRRQREEQEAAMAAQRREAEARAAAERERLAAERAEVERQRAENERVERQRREAAEAQARAEREAAEAREREAEAQRQAAAAAEAARLSRLHGAAPRMLSILKAIEASTWFASFDAALSDSVRGVIAEAE